MFGTIFGRSDKLNDVEIALSKNKCVILTGVGGIGKSAVALAYAHGLKKDGDWIIQHIICEGTTSLCEAITRLEFDNFQDDGTDEEASFNRKLDILKASRKPVLIIFDNLNHKFSPDDKAVFKEILKFDPIYILITSRQSLTNKKQLVVEIDPLDDDALLELYTYYRFTKDDNHSEYINKHGKILKEMFALVGRHTLMIELLAKLPLRSGLDEFKINQYLSDTLNISDDKVPIIKDDNEAENSIKEIIKGLFSISRLDDLEKSIMRHMALIPLCGIDLKLFIGLTGCDRMTILRLRDSHWITIDEETLKIRLHPLICETILNTNEIKPSEKTCHMFLTKLQEKIDNSELQSPEYYQYMKIMLSARRGLLFSLFPISVLKEEYRSALLFLDKGAKKFLSDDKS